MKRIAISSLSLSVMLAALQAAPLPVAKLDRKTPVDFHTEVVPVLKANCTACHNKTTTKAGLNMETPQLMLKGGESGPSITPGNGADSLLFQSAVHDGDSDMPPKGNKVGAVNLSPDELALLKLWIDQGAKAGEKKAQEIAWQPLPPGLNPIYTVAMSPVGDLVACSRANQIFVYDVAAKKQIAQFSAHRDVVCSLAFSTDGTRLASGSFGEVKLWKSDGAPALPTEVAKLSRSVGIAALDVAFYTADAAAQDKEVAAVKDRVKKANEAIADTKKKVEEKQKAAKAASDAKVAAQKAHADASAVAANPPKPKPNPALEKKLSDAKTATEAATKAEAEASAAVASAPKDKPDPALAKAQAAAKTKLDAAKKAEAAVAAAVAAAMTVKPDPTLAKKATDAKTKLDAAIKAETDANEAVKAAETAANDAAAEVPKVAKLQADTEKLAAAAKAALAAAQASQKKLAADLAAASKNAKPAPAAIPTKWTLERTLGTGDTASTINDRVNALAFSPDDKTFAVGSGAPSRDGDITLYDLASGKAVQTMSDRHSDAVLCLEFSPDGKLIASGGADKQLRVSDVATGKLLKTFEGHTHHVMGVSWRADGRVIASSGADNAVKIWDWIKGERRKNLDGWDKEVTSVHYLGTSTRLVTSSGDKQVRLIGEDASAPAPLPGTADFMDSSAVSFEGDRVAAGGEDSVLRVWDVKTAKEIASFVKPQSETAAK